jgi:hypothetical protein
MDASASTSRRVDRPLQPLPCPLAVRYLAVI